MRTHWGRVTDGFLEMMTFHSSVFTLFSLMRSIFSSSERESRTLLLGSCWPRRTRSSSVCRNASQRAIFYSTNTFILTNNTWILYCPRERRDLSPDTRDSSEKDRRRVRRSHERRRLWFPPPPRSRRSLSRLLVLSNRSDINTLLLAEIFKGEKKKKPSLHSEKGSGFSGYYFRLLVL